MNLVRVLFKKHHPQQDGSLPVDGDTPPGSSGRSSPTVAVEVDSDVEAGGRSPRAGSPSRRTRSERGKTTVVEGDSVKATAVLPKQMRTTVVFKAIKMSSSKRFAQVLPNLLLGSQEMAHDLRSLRHCGVTHILNVTAEVVDRFPGQYVYKRIAISDMPSTPIVKHFDEAFQFIDAGRAVADGVVLVHCYYGNSRSATVVIGYLMMSERMRYSDALEYLRILRPDVRPNDGFQRQLKAFEATVRR